jgi:PAS domain S-box-containing protein
MPHRVLTWASNRADMRGMRDRAWRIVLGMGVALSLGYFLLPKGFALNGLYDAMNFASAAALVIGVRLYRPPRRLPWYLLAAGQTLSALGNFSYDYDSLIRHISPPFPGLSDALYLIAYPVMASGLLLLVRSRSRGRDRASLVDATIVAVGLGMLSWVFLMMPYATDPTLSLQEKLVSIAYPLMDIFLLFVVVRLVVGGGQRPPAFWFLALSFTSMLVADAVYARMVLTGTYVDGSWVDLGWLLGFVFFGVAGLHPSMRELGAPAEDRVMQLSRRRLAMLAVAALAAPIALLFPVVRSHPEAVVVVAAGSLVLFLLVLYRMSGLVREVESNVEELRRQGGRVEEAEARYRGVVEHIPAVSYIEDVPAGNPGIERVLYVSPQVDTMLGCSRRDWADGARRELVHPEDRERVEQARRRHRAEGTAFREEYRVVANGRTVWVREEATVAADRLDGDGDRRWQGVMFDVTGHRLAQDALRRALRREREAGSRLRALDEMKTTFLHAVSHELRTPLASILGSALTLDNDQMPLSDEDARDLIRRLGLNARKLDRLLSDLLDLDRLDRGILEPNRLPVDLAAMARRLVDDQSLPLAGRPIEVVAEPILAEVDPAMVERIVENLLINAVRHTARGTPIWVRVESLEAGVVVSVEDAGPGVPEGLRAGIFEPFRQGPGRDEHSPGVGIGLSLVARFAELHGGRAWIEDRPGGGAAFRVSLPARVIRLDEPEPGERRGARTPAG